MRLDSMMQELALQTAASTARNAPGDAGDAFFDHATGTWTNTAATLMKTLRLKHKGMGITSVSHRSDLLSWAETTHKASFEKLVDEGTMGEPFLTQIYLAPPSRLDGPGAGTLIEDLHFGKFVYRHSNEEYILYIFNGRDGNNMYPVISQFLVHAPTEEATSKINDLIRAAGQWQTELHDEIWVFDQGYWQKDAALYQSVMKARWENVILDAREKKLIQDDAQRFFDGRERYEALGVPWKRGVIYHGPPGNGKTISIKALMHTLYQRDLVVPTMYVKSFSGYGGPEASIKNIFNKSRKEAPCLLIFEDLDSLVTDAVRSYFLNEVDGIANNSGIMIIGSTNHLDRLDPGLSKRPSRFDRKFYFPKPDFEQRVAYCEFWRRKLADNEEVKFPQALCPEIAKITDDFSFAYMQEAFVSALLVIAFDEDEGEDEAKDDRDFEELRLPDPASHDKFDDLRLWRELKKQIKNLREEM